MKKAVILTLVSIISVASLSTSAFAMGRPPTPEENNQLLEFSKKHDYFGAVQVLSSTDCTHETTYNYDYDNNTSVYMGPYFSGGKFLGRTAGKNACLAKAASFSPESLQKVGAAGFDLSSISANGKSFTGVLTMESPFFAEVMTSRSPESRIRYQVTLTTCDGKDVSQKSKIESLEDLVEQFQGIDFKSYFNCNLNLKFEASDSIPLQNYSDLQPLSGSATVLSSGQFVMSFTGSVHQNQVILEPSKREKDVARKGQALKAARDFVELIKSHGNEIIRASDPGLSDKERQMILQASLQAKKPLIVDAIKRLNRDYSELELMEKFSTSVSVRDAYDFVKEIETRVGNLRDFSQRLNLGNIFNLQ